MKHVGKDCACDTGGTIDGVAYNDCNGNALPAGTQIATCNDIPVVVTYAITALDASAATQTAVDAAGNRTFKVRAKLSAAAGNKLSLAPDGLYVEPYVLHDCDDTPLASGTNVPTCDMLPVEASLSYVLAGGASPEPSEDAGLAGDQYGSERFNEVRLSFLNRVGDELFAVDFTDMFNEVADEVLPQTTVAAGAGISVTGSESAGYTITAALTNSIITVTDADVLTDALFGNSYSLTRAQIRARGYSGLIVVVDTTDPCTIVCPADCIVGESFTIMQASAAQVSVAARTTGTGAAEIAAASVFVGSTREQWSNITAICMRADAATLGPRWVLMGDLAYAEA